DGVRVVIHPRLLEEEERGKLRELCAEYDVVVANTIIAWPAVRAARAAGKRVIWYLHETLVAVRLMREIAEMMPTLDLATLLVTPTRQTARIFQDLTPTTIEVVPYGIPAPSIAARNNKNGRKAFITMASLEPRKGQDILVQAIKLLPKDLQASATFRIVGRPLEPIFCERLRADATGINAIEFTGELNHVRSLELLAASDALVCSSRDETMPLAILEAMSLGKVVISTDVGGIAEWVRDEMNGLLVEQDNPTALARALERCLENEGLTKRLRTGAQRTYARHFTLERFAQHFARLLIDLSPASRVRDANIATGYAEWLEQTGKIDHAKLRRRLRRMRREPLISVLLPVYNPDLELLKVAIDSIKSQVYENWQLCIADDASTDASVRPFLEGQARDENRIKLTFRERNGHISACSNSALQLATGEWCALLDQDDVVAPEALAGVAIEIDRHPDAGLIYSDEDKIDRAGKRSEPFSKPIGIQSYFLVRITSIISEFIGVICCARSADSVRDWKVRRIMTLLCAASNFCSHRRCVTSRGSFIIGAPSREVWRRSWMRNRMRKRRRDARSVILCDAEKSRRVWKLVPKVSNRIASSTNCRNRRRSFRSSFRRATGLNCSNNA
ncbi:MAG: glycosyltransferase, partial [Chthoniobacterales bacterium]